MTRLLALAITATLAASPVAALDRAAIESTVKGIKESATIRSITPTPIAGLNEVVADGSVVYISDDGKYVVSGILLDVEGRTNLTDRALAGVRTQALDAVPADQRIVFKPHGEVKHRVVVFTDISCSYCQLLHEKLPEYLARGIQVEYLAFPRGGRESPVYAQMAQIWCAEDRNVAFSNAVAGRAVTAVACESPVLDHYDLGDRLGVEGTPAIYDAYGHQLGGFLEPADLERRLSQNKQRADGRAVAAR